MPEVTTKKGFLNPDFGYFQVSGLLTKIMKYDPGSAARVPRS
jgi:hypothetical protein